MAYTTPTTQALKDSNLANLEGELGQNAPIADKAFLRVLAALEALIGTSLAKLAADRVRQSLALTATGEGLDDVGGEYGVIRKAAVAAELTVTLPATTGTIIPTTTPFIGDANGVRYFPITQVVAAAGVATINLQADETGVSGNLQVSDTLTIGTQIAGAETTATVTVVDTVGSDRETDSDYRPRVLDAIRSEGGGGNAFDYRSWAEEVSGVARAYPFAGQPTVPGTPPDRTVFVEATTDIDADGIAPPALLDDVRDNITTDPLTGLSRQPLGLTDATLWVESITRTTINVTVTNLLVDIAIEAAVKAEIDAALASYFLSLDPFVDGLDFIGDKNDTVTDLTVSQVVQDILSANDASATAVSVSVATPYVLDPGEEAKIGTVSYV
jgi:uncharacterized phage protein gp47/JayE